MFADVQNKNLSCRHQQIRYETNHKSALKMVGVIIQLDILNKALIFP